MPTYISSLYEAIIIVGRSLSLSVCMSICLSVDVTATSVSVRPSLWMSGCTAAVPSLFLSYNVHVCMQLFLPMLNGGGRVDGGH